MYSADGNWCGAKKGFILGIVKGQDRQQTEQGGGRGIEGAGSLKERKNGYEADKGAFPLAWAAAQYQEWVYG